MSSYPRDSLLAYKTTVQLGLQEQPRINNSYGSLCTNMVTPLPISMFLRPFALRLLRVVGSPPPAYHFLILPYLYSLPLRHHNTRQSQQLQPECTATHLVRLTDILPEICKVVGQPGRNVGPDELSRGMLHLLAKGVIPT
jgi:hypothetical protein